MFIFQKIADFKDEVTNLSVCVFCIQHFNSIGKYDIVAAVLSVLEKSPYILTAREKMRSPYAPFCRENIVTACSHRVWRSAFCSPSASINYFAFVESFAFLDTRDVDFKNVTRVDNSPSASCVIIRINRLNCTGHDVCRIFLFLLRREWSYFCEHDRYAKCECYDTAQGEDYYLHGV